MSQALIDSDGHIIENFDEIWTFMPTVYHEAEYRMGKGLFPELDNVHISGGLRPEGSFDFSVDAQAWIRFADALNIESAVLYPTSGLAFGRARHVGWARAVAHAYNDWLAQYYLAKSRSLRGMALIPLQDIPAAVKELRRAVNELGMCGAMLPVSGLNGLLGDAQYRPIYEAADDLGCTLAVHSGSYAGFGLEQMNTLAGAQALGHPYGNMIHFVSMAINGIFDDYRNVRYGFLEAGAAWTLFLLERLNGSYHNFVPVDPDGQLVRLHPGESMREHLLEHFRNGRIFVGVEGDEPDLPYVVRQIGPQSFVFSSDFPHEVNLESCRHEVVELMENPELSTADKAAILHDNGARFYRL